MADIAMADRARTHAPSLFPVKGIRANELEFTIYENKSTGQRTIKLATAEYKLLSTVCGGISAKHVREWAGCDLPEIMVRALDSTGRTTSGPSRSADTSTTIEEGSARCRGGMERALETDSHMQVTRSEPEVTAEDEHSAQARAADASTSPPSGGKRASPRLSETGLTKRPRGKGLMNMPPNKRLAREVALRRERDKRYRDKKKREAAAWAAQEEDEAAEAAPPMTAEEWALARDQALRMQGEPVLCEPARCFYISANGLYVADDED